MHNIHKSDDRSNSRTGTDGLGAWRALRGDPPERAADDPDDDALFEAWARGYRQGLQDGKERAPAVRLYPLVPAALDTGDSAGGPRRG